MDDHDGFTAALARYAGATSGTNTARSSVARWTPSRGLPSARTRHLSQWVRMMRAVARLQESGEDTSEILAVEASTPPAARRRRQCSAAQVVYALFAAL